MRDILFRGKRKDNGEWVYGYYVKYGFTGSEKHYILPYYASALYAIEVIPETVGQFIQKINGVDIFHHDIVRAYKYGDKEEGLFVNEITHRHGTWWFGSWMWLEFLNIFRCVEVIGSSHDNPDLLKGEDAE